MSVHLYLSSLPEALIGSMLPPDEFGRHLALGAGKHTRSQAVFFEVDQEIASEHFHLAPLREKCVAHSDGSPRRSSYVSIYRVLERLPARALKKLYLTTRDGTTLGIDPAESADLNAGGGYHLYQEFCPVAPKVVSRLGPREFSKTITDPQNAVFVPKIIFADLRLGDLASDPEAKVELPYSDLKHIRYCLNDLQAQPEKASKIVTRLNRTDVEFWMVEHGFIVASNEEFRLFPIPDEDELRAKNPDWWSSAGAVGLM